MTTLGTRHTQDITTEGTLFVAFELSEKTWKLGFTTGHGQKPRERTVTARQQERVLDEIAQAKRRLGLSARPPWSVVMKRGAKASGCIGFCRDTGSRTMLWISPAIEVNRRRVGPRAMGWTCASS